MPARVLAAAIQGIDAVEVKVEVDVLRGLAGFTVVGLGDKAVQESKERLTAALQNIEYEPPRRKTIISLAPASLKKEGSHYDLAIALGFLEASGQLEASENVFQNKWIIGELGLDGTIRPVTGVLPIALTAAKKGIKELYVPWENRAEVAAVADQIKVYAVSSLTQLISHLRGKEPIKPLTDNKESAAYETPEVDFADIKGQEQAKRALLIAAGASHNVLLVGPPGTGKTLLARALAGILPPLSREESYVVTSLYSVAGLLPAGQGLITQRPFRSPHHGASSVALVGGGTNPRPGEVSLAHTGVLFLDELPEFPRSVLDSLRQPIEDGSITISRASTTLRFPARSVLVGAMNPCKCGYLGSQRRSCSCSGVEAMRYQRKVSGPLLDRFDIHLMVNDVALEELLADENISKKKTDTPSSSKELAQIAFRARERQIQRQGKTNSDLKAAEIKKYCSIDKVSENLLMQAEKKFHLSSRGVHRLMKVARTIADIEDMKNITSLHMAEALQYREQLQTALPEFV